MLGSEGIVQLISVNSLITFECDDNSRQNTYLIKFWSFIKGLRKENPFISYISELQWQSAS